MPGKKKKIKIQQPGIKKKKAESCENILLIPLKDKQKEVLCTWQNRRNLRTSPSTWRLSILGSEGDSTITSPEPCPAVKSFLQHPWAEHPGIRGDLSHYEPRALPRGQAIPASCSQQAAAQPTSTPLRQSACSRQPALFLEKRQFPACFLTGREDRGYFWGPVTMGKSVPGGVDILFAHCIPRPNEWHEVHS